MATMTPSKNALEKSEGKTIIAYLANGAKNGECAVVQRFYSPTIRFSSPNDTYLNPDFNSYTLLSTSFLYQ